MRFLKIAGLWGIIAPLIFFSFTFSSIYLTPDFSWTKHALSHLGYWSGEMDKILTPRGIAAVLFNFATIALGGLNIVFTIGIMKLEGSPLCKLGTLPFILDMVFLCAVGLFPMGFNDAIHKTFTRLLFRSASPSFLVLGFGFLTTSDKIFGILSFITGAAMFLGFFKLQVSTAISEVIFVSALSTYTILLGIRMRRG